MDDVVPTFSHLPNGRFGVTPRSTAGGITRPIGDRHYDVQQFTGYPTSTVGEGQWVRGRIVRTATPVLRPSGRELFMYDPTNANGSWNDARN